MKYLAYTLVVLTGSILAQANNIRGSDACTSFAAQAVKDYDWQVHQDDFNEAVVTKENVGRVKNQILYVVRAGNKVRRDNKANSTYSVTVEFSNNDVYGTGAKISCEALEIRETRNRS